MPYRALLWTMMTVALALVAVAMWVRAVEPLLAAANRSAGQNAASRPAEGGAGEGTEALRHKGTEGGKAETQVAGTQVAGTQVAGTQGASTQGASSRAVGVPAEKGLQRLVHGTLLLSFVLICMLLVVGLAATFREWVRYRTAEGKRGRKGSKTVYVDAWKIAGERMRPEGREGGDKGTS